MDPVLPQNDPQPSKRVAGLEQKRAQYRYNYTINPPLAMAESVPFHDQPAFGWLKLAAVYTVKLLKNNRLAAQSIEHKSALSRAVDILVNLGREIATDPDNLFKDAKAAIESAQVQGRPSSLDDYAKLFQSIALPPIAATFRDDSSFASNFVSATNPLIIERVRSIDASRFPITDAQFQSVMGASATLASFGAAGRLFMADYKMVEGAATSSYKGAQRYLYAPIVLFAASDAGTLVPVAIQIEQKPAADNPVFLPSHGINLSLIHI